MIAEHDKLVFCLDLNKAFVLLSGKQDHFPGGLHNAEQQSRVPLFPLQGGIGGSLVDPTDQLTDLAGGRQLFEQLGCFLDIDLLALLRSSYYIKTLILSTCNIILHYVFFVKFFRRAAARCFPDRKAPPLRQRVPRLSSRKTAGKTTPPAAGFGRGRRFALAIINDC